ncbi:galectin-related inter-fiber protein [Rhinolophus ferrumequinum]|uniref:Galectin n=1 Tax=Rhinolophus ferrumequinum TaxID=59479 RepID=A0A7J7RX17_RHIFE|nr:grifin [Rhinolophus ferrumequinum]KAF6280736.1 galectin-related inter-fiber protein [Rhinolophus ferrumequinum]
MALQFEAFCAEDLAPGWNLLGRGHSDWRGQFEINFLSEEGMSFFTSSSILYCHQVGTSRPRGQEGVSCIFPLVLGEHFQMEVRADAQHFHVHAQEYKVLQFAHGRHRPLAAVTHVQVLTDHRLAQVELAGGA